MSTGPLNLNWIGNVFKGRARSDEGAQTAPSELSSQPSVPQDHASLDAGQQRYLAFAQSAPVETPSSDIETPTPGAEGPSPSNGLDVEWVTGSSIQSVPKASTSSGLEVEWRSGSSSQSPAPNAPLDVEWKTGHTSSGLGMGTSGSYGSRTGGLDVEWVGGSSRGLGGGLSGGSTTGLEGTLGGGRSRGLGGGLNGGSTKGLNGGLNGGSSNGVDGGLNGGSSQGLDGSLNGGTSNGVDGGLNDKATGGVKAGGSPADAAALAEIQTQLLAPLPEIPERPTSDNWQQNDLRNRAALIVSIRQDPGLQAALANWDQLPDSMRLEAGKRISSLQGAIYGFTPAGIQLDVSLRPPSNGYYDPGSNQLHVSQGVLADPQNFVNTVTHEQAHAYQWEKGAAAKQGRMAETDPLYATALTWHDNYFNYQDPANSYQAYRQQPIEVHAFATGDAVAAGVFGK